MKNKLYNALFSELNPYFYIKVKDGRSETGNKESYYGKIPRDDRCTFDISNNKVLVHMGESGKIKAANFYRDCYPADDIPGVWMHKDFSSVAVSYEIFINGHYYFDQHLQCSALYGRLRFVGRQEGGVISIRN